MRQDETNWLIPSSLSDSQRIKQFIPMIVLERVDSQKVNKYHDNAQHPWSNWFINHFGNDTGNRNLQEFSIILSSEENEVKKLQSLVKEIDTVNLAAYANNNIMIMHSPKNFGGARTRLDNKGICMIGMGSQTVHILIDLNSALADCNIIVPTVQELLDCKTAQDVAKSSAPGDIGLI